MTEPTFEDFYPTEPKTGLSREEAEEYGGYYPESAPPKTETTDLSTLLSLAAEAIDAGNLYPKEDTK